VEVDPTHVNFSVESPRCTSGYTQALWRGTPGPSPDGRRYPGGRVATSRGIPALAKPRSPMAVIIHLGRGPALFRALSDAELSPCDVPVLAEPAGGPPPPSSPRRCDASPAPVGCGGPHRAGRPRCIGATAGAELVGHHRGPSADGRPLASRRRRAAGGPRCSTKSTVVVNEYSARPLLHRPFDRPGGLLRLASMRAGSAGGPARGPRFSQAWAIQAATVIAWSRRRRLFSSTSRRPCHFRGERRRGPARPHGDLPNNGPVGGGESRARPACIQKAGPRGTGHFPPDLSLAPFPPPLRGRW